ncbi:MAG: hypothetical protein WBD83_20810, partial [Xanthobacteraceae bacterium]
MTVARDGARGSFVSSGSPLLPAGLRDGAPRNFGCGRRATVGLRPGLPTLLTFMEGFSPPRESPCEYSPRAALVQRR